MRKLTDDERVMVEDNHKLIFDFLHKRGLNQDEYYGLIAESLCKAVLNWDESKGKLSTLFYTIATNDLYREWRKSTAEKRQHKGMFPLEEDWITSDYNLEDGVILKETLEELENSEYRELLELRLLGYNQGQIADMLGINQVTVSRRLKRMGEIYFDRKG